MSSKQKNTTNKKDVIKVQQQYQHLPYPMRNPEDENNRLLSVVGESFAELNHWLYKGTENFRSGFRMLIAGGGTGDASTFLAEQCRDIDNAEIIYLDFAQTSLDIAKKRAEIRGLTNIKWICDSILNIPKLKLGKFDFINCSGVLHHLASPDDGLRILRDSLTETGGMHLMVYAKYGRTGLYQIQEIMKMINQNVTDIDKEISNAKALLASLPSTNWFVRAGELLQDHISFGDIGLYDMFLHKQDRAYSISELHEFIRRADLNFVEFAVAETRLLLKPESYIKDAQLLADIKTKTLAEQQAICEIISGKIIKHDFFVSAQKDSITTIADLDNIPYFYYNTAHIAKQIYEYIDTNKVAAGQQVSFNLNSTTLHFDANINFPTSQCTKIILKSLMDGGKTLREIFAAIKQELQVELTDEILINELQITLKPFIETGILFLRDKSIAPFRDYAQAELAK